MEADTLARDLDRAIALSTHTDACRCAPCLAHVARWARDLGYTEQDYERAERRRQVDSESTSARRPVGLAFAIGFAACALALVTCGAG